MLAKLPTACALTAEIFLRKGIHQQDNNHAANSGVQSYELTGCADILKASPSEVAWESSVGDLSPPRLARRFLHCSQKTRL